MPDTEALGLQHLQLMTRGLRFRSMLNKSPVEGASGNGAMHLKLMTDILRLGKASQSDLERWVYGQGDLC